jgi:chromosome segregation ATPase
MKDSITTDINNIMKKHSLLKSKQDDTILELKARLENLKVLQMKTDDLSNRFNNTCDNQPKEIAYLKDDIHRKERDIHQLKIEQDNYTADIKKTQSGINNLDLALGDLTRKNEWTVADMANTIRRLEESN